MTPVRSTSTKFFGSLLRTWGHARDGGVAVTVAVMAAVLVGVLALAIDVGRIYNASSDLNHAADAYALAGATQLNGEQDACTRSIQAVIEADLANQEKFGSNEPDPIFYVDPALDPVNNKSIRFFSVLDKDADGNVTDLGLITDADECGQEARYIEVTLDQVDGSDDDYRVDLYFAGVIGALTEANPKGYAIAEHGSALCITVPMMMCSLDDSPYLPAGSTFMEALDSYELTGRGLFLKAQKQSDQWGSGNFGFLRLEGAGAKELGELIGGINNQPDCLGIDELETEPGSNSGARKYFNTRFDIWHGDVVGLMNDPNYQPSPNAVKGWLNNGSSCAYTPSGYVDPPTPYTGPGSYGNPPNPPAGTAMPFPRDECSYGGACAGTGTVARMGDGVWDETAYMAVNHGGVMTPIGADWDIDWPGPLHPDGKWSRYERYLWELDRQYGSFPGHGGTGGGFEEVGPAHRIPDNGADGPDPTGEYAGDRDAISSDGMPQCYTGPMGLDPNIYKKDRRVEEILVVNCDPNKGGIEIKGKTTIPHAAILGSMRIFFLEPWQVNGGVHEISAEIIGPGDPCPEDPDDPVKCLQDQKREWVQLKEGRNALK